MSGLDKKGTFSYTFIVEVLIRDAFNLMVSYAGLNSLFQ